jgi:gas vesicle protein
MSCGQDTTQTEQPRCGGLSLLFAFFGGALVGGIVATLYAPRSGAETRRRMADAVDEARARASRVPEAVCEASSAARDAFTAAMKDNSA